MTSSTVTSETAKEPMLPTNADPDTSSLKTESQDSKLGSSRPRQVRKTVPFGYRQPLSERAYHLTAHPTDIAAKKQEQALNSAYGSLHMVRSRLEEMRLIAIRAQDAELPEHVRQGLARRFEKIKTEVSILSSDFKTSMSQENVVMT